MILGARLRILLALYGKDGMTSGDIEIQHYRLFGFEIKYVVVTLRLMEREGLVSRGAMQRNYKWPGRPASLWRLTPSGQRNPVLLAHVWRMLEAEAMDA